MKPCWIGFGGNLGDVPAHWQQVLNRLEHDPQFANLRISSLYRSVPMGADAGDAFWNAVAEVESSLAPFDVLRKLQQWEAELGRVRTVRWGPRALDLDLLAYGDQTVNTPELVVPHVGLWYRRFVLDPWVEISPEWKHPAYGLTVRQFQDRLLGPRQLWLRGDWPADWHAQVFRQAGQRFPDLSCDLVEKVEFPATGIVADFVVSDRQDHGTEPTLRFSPDDDLPTVCQHVVDVLTAAYEPPERVPAA
ncbi:2-amino-4-hydroxy-6-hydroxymethyldihydropteridine diphosphokinase [bacterium]|nr:2-amino-4-hydroxy-6-hydroxymethyldihydropteridine diphosphokinase [bacterium]